MVARFLRAPGWVRWAAGLAGFAALVAAIDVIQVVAQFAVYDAPFPHPLQLWALAWIEWLFRSILIPLGLIASRRFPLDAPGRRFRNAAVHLVIGLFGPPLRIAASIPGVIPQFRFGIPGDPTGPLEIFTNTELFLLSRYLLPTMAMYAVVVGVHHAWTYQRRYEQSARRQLRLEAMLDTARLAALRAQIRPHFLFNTLNAITVLARTGQGEKVAETTTFLAEMLRLSLASEEQLVPLDDELRLVQAYLKVEGVRFEDRLRVAWVVQSDVIDLLVPAFILQPLVENAIRHGASPRRDRTTVSIGVQRLDQRLHLWVEDDGPGLALTPSPQGRGIGLGHTRERLSHLFGDDQSLRIRTAPGRGFRVDVLIPLLQRGRGTGSAA